MKIISKFKDYYDSVQGVMYDSDIIYFRKQVELGSHKSIDSLSGYNPVSNLNFIGFCGKIYLVFTHDIDFRYDIYEKISDVSQYLIDNKLQGKCFQLHDSYHIDKFTTYEIKTGYEINNLTKRYSENISYFIDKIMKQVNEIKALNLFEKHKTPIFIINFNQYGQKSLTTGINLSEYNFQQVFDPYSAYQELVMWIGNQAVSEYPPQIKDDIVIRDSKGFDGWSFKNKWSEKKIRRSRRK